MRTYIVYEKTIDLRSSNLGVSTCSKQRGGEADSNYVENQLDPNRGTRDQNVHVTPRVFFTASAFGRLRQALTMSAPFSARIAATSKPIPELLSVTR
ncbi:MAG: hypothetical protein AAGC91_04320 [Pseudomonadota bacterium]